MMYSTISRKALFVLVTASIVLTLLPWEQYAQEPSGTQSSQSLITREISQPETGRRGSGVSRSREVKLNQEVISELLEVASESRDLRFFSTLPAAQLQFNLFDTAANGLFIKPLWRAQ